MNLLILISSETHMSHHQIVGGVLTADQRLGGSFTQTLLF